MELTFGIDDLEIVDGNEWTGFEDLLAEVNEEVDELLADMDLDEE